jgi:uncharacterized membrane protein
LGKLPPDRARGRVPYGLIMEMKSRNLTMIGLAGVGLVVALYLLTVHWGWWTAVCLGVGNCEVVNTSIYSELLGIPVALLGALTYLGLIVLGLAVWQEMYAEYARLARFFIAVIGVVFSAYLTYIEFFVLHEICPWCVSSAILITLIAILSIVDLRAEETEIVES